MKYNITTDNAQSILEKNLDQLDIQNLVYEFAMGVVQKQIDEIENTYNVKDEEGDGEAKWYDEIREEFMQSFFEKLSQF